MAISEVSHFLPIFLISSSLSNTPVILLIFELPSPDVSYLKLGV